jgi:type III pantothenate kinase
MLLVDIGNSRVKWAACDSQGRLEPQQAAEYQRWTAADWRKALFAGHDCDRVIAACVAGDDRRRLLEDAARASGVPEVTFAATSAAAGGVRNAYAQPELLGVDRWLALIGAWNLHRRACCIVDVGTATTVDVVDDSGQHLGGFIVPGPRLMVEALHTGTSDLAAFTAASAQGAAALWADNTRDAIERGCCLALAALVDRSAAQLAGRVGHAPALLGTGGALDLVQPYVLSDIEPVPELVLRGLARVALSAT